MIDDNIRVIRLPWGSGTLNYINCDFLSEKNFNKLLDGDISFLPKGIYIYTSVPLGLADDIFPPSKRKLYVLRGMLVSRSHPRRAEGRWIETWQLRTVGGAHVYINIPADEAEKFDLGIGSRVAIAALLRFNKKGYPVFEFLSAWDDETEEMIKQASVAEDTKTQNISYEDAVSIISSDLWAYEYPARAAVLAAISSAPWHEDFRSFIHILIVGNPNTGKSVFLKNVHKYLNAPYVYAKSVSSTGLTASVIKINDHWVVQKGILPHAHRAGIIAIDEIDKASQTDLAALHEAMDHGTITISKAGIHTVLPASVAIVAAARPKQQVFKTDDYLSEINLSPSILSRFDLIFVYNFHNKRKIIERVARKRYLSPPQNVAALKYKILQYIAAARRHEPALPEEVKDKIVEKALEFMDSRKLYDVRLGLAAVRLARAAAKARFHDIVTDEDIAEAMRIMEAAYVPEPPPYDPKLLDDLEALEKEVGEEGVRRLALAGII